MRKIKLYIAMSLNGKIAYPDGSVDWLESIPNPTNTDYGYSSFYKTIDTTIQGNSTYNQIISWGIDFPYADKKNYVLTRKKDSKNTNHVEFISENHIDFIRQLKKEKGQDIWLIGGGQANTMLLNEKLIDVIQVFIMPVIIQGGIELFETLPKETKLTLTKTKTYSTGAIELQYKVE
jgi:dihydrofolate reductase